MSGAALKGVKNATKTTASSGVPQDVTLHSHIETEMHDVTLADNIFLSLQAQLAGITCPRFALTGNIVREGDHLGPDETVLEIRMNDARRLRSGSA